MELQELELLLRSHAGVRDAVVVRPRPTAGSDALVAYVVPDFEQNMPAAGAVEHAQVERWRKIYESIYNAPPAHGDPLFNIVGWTSGYDRTAIPAAAMRAWIDDSVQRILSCSPRSVLELGCGTGLVLFRVAPYCESYCATDVSAAALAYVKSVLSSAECFEHGHIPITLLECPADDFSGIPARSFDVVVMNSVTQHFPGESYLNRVLARALQAVAPRGKIYIGDVRNLATLHASHLAMQLERAASELATDKLRERTSRAMALDQELVISQDYFRSLPARFPAVKAVEIQLKRSGYDNELTRFRYEVLLHCSDQPHIDVDSRITWQQSLTVPAIALLLKDGSADLLQIADIPNPRVAACLRTVSYVRQQRLSSIGQLRAALQQPLRCDELEGIEPRELVQLGGKYGYEVELHASADGDAAKFDAVFRRSLAERDAERPIPARAECATPIGHDLTNDPLCARASRRLIVELRARLAAALPSDMVPTILTVQRLPRTAGGEIDRSKLPQPELF
jgi:ubiquinone/menaquinone biosynthesis C-methylase UbiE